MNRCLGARLSLAVAALAATLFGSEKEPYPNRWVRVSTNLRDDSEIERVRKIVETAAGHGLNAIALSAGLDSLDLKSPEYFRRLNEIRQICARHKMEIVPSFISAGYGGAVLAHDKNLAAGLAVRDALFVVHQGKADLVPDPVVKLTNGGFESHDEGQIDGFLLAGKLGARVSIDNTVFKGGKAAARFGEFSKFPREWARIGQEVRVQPYRCYRLTCWIKSENIGASDPFGSGNFQLEVLGGDEKRPLQYENPRVRSTSEWQEVAPKVRGTAEGKFWLDDLQVEEVGLVNVLRRPGTPVTVRSEKEGTVYEEGRDYGPIADPRLNFRYDHQGPGLLLLPGGRIKEGERLRVSYYHGTSIYNGQTPICMSEPKVYEIWRTQVRLVHQTLAPGKYLLNMDEVRTGGSCEACKSRGLTLGQIVGDCLTRQFNMVREVNPKSEIFAWSDMLDPNHNANPSRKYYYLAEGNYAGSWNYVPRDLGIVCWYYEKRVESLRHFSGMGFRTMAGAYYDADNLENPRQWLQALSATSGACGVMYTTWLNKYDLLGAFGDLVSGKN